MIVGTVLLCMVETGVCQTLVSPTIYNTKEECVSAIETQLSVWASDPSNPKFTAAYECHNFGTMVTD